MEVTYYIAKNNNKCAKFTTKNSINDYNIEGIRKGKRFENEQRRKLVINIIALNNIRHTHLQVLSHYLGKMAKKTTDAILEELEKDNLIESEKIGDSSNSVKIWSIKSKEFEFEKHAKQESKNIINSLEKYVRSIEKNYEKLNYIMKDYAIIHLLDIIQSWQPIIEIINQDTKIKNEKKKFDSLVNRSYQILKDKNREHIDGRPILRRLLHLKASEPMMIMDNFLKEIK